MVWEGCKINCLIYFQITRKLAGRAAGTASWCTNVGNEHGQVLISVMTDSEGEGLADMAEGLMQRYQLSNQPPPKLMYVDRGCCFGTGNNSKLQELFHEWSDLIIRLDIWHFLCRFSVACTSQSHALYSAFMSRLSACLFEWDAEDLTRLRRSKEAELSSGVWSLEKDNVDLHISKKELQLHCKRRTRGTAETSRLIKEVIDIFSSDSGKDTMGISLLHRGSILQIWNEQQRHIECIQDPADTTIQLYTQTGSLVKGGQRLPIYRCARGSTSLESFHLHINRFIPGKFSILYHLHTNLISGILSFHIIYALAQPCQVNCKVNTITSTFLF